MIDLKKGIDELYFINDRPKYKFGTFLEYYGPKGDDIQYRANIYLAAVPEIFELLREADVSSGDNAPLVTLMKYSDTEDELIPANPGLNGSATELLNIGMSLFNGRQCSLDFSPSNEYGFAIMQAMKIRYNLNWVEMR
ncbi:hypothetical protein [Planococcus sp. NCCP-2050]|uniref:hypothetical protein n=1 Tax=Planococcus sp. NCCP-2050 TaxID=2944679 RepID=UPI00204091BB|nr:hypothetical protein [Planococcus sp. NCCP-2050]GKW46916.1 hypothetical protein NCCP2050_26080 [Planococcus sp. NCCP-2050]